MTAKNFGVHESTRGKLRRIAFGKVGDRVNLRGLARPSSLHHKRMFFGTALDEYTNLLPDAFRLATFHDFPLA
jgi:hypothetical protein